MFTTHLVNIYNKNIFKTSVYIYIFQDEKCRLIYLYLWWGPEKEKDDFYTQFKTHETQHLWSVLCQFHFLNDAETFSKTIFLIWNSINYTLNIASMSSSYSKVFWLSPRKEKILSDEATIKSWNI